MRHGKIALATLLLSTFDCTNAVNDHDSVFSELSATAQTVNWGRIAIGMSHSDVERALGLPLPRVEDDYTDACGSKFTTVVVADRPTYIQWADESPHEIESIVVMLQATDLTPDVGRTVRGRVRGGKQPCRAPEGPDLPVCFVHDSGTAVWVSTDPYPVLRITLEDCTD